MIDKSPRRTMPLAFASAFLMLLVIGAASYRGNVISTRSGQSVRHTHEVLESLQDLLFAMRSLESDCRGFVLTGDAAYLDAYRASVSRETTGESTVARLTADNPVQQRRLPALAALAAEKTRLAERVIAARQAQGLEAAAAIIRSGQGQRITNDFQEIVRTMQDEELRLLALRTADATLRVPARPTSILILGTVLGLLITGAAGWSVQRDSSRRARAEEALRRSDERYRMLLDGVQDYAIFMMDPQGQIVSWNAGAERIKGYTADEIIGRNFSCFFPPEDIERGRPAGGAPADRRKRPARGTRHARAEGRLAIPGERHLHRVARPDRKSARVFRDQPRPQREQGVGGEVPRAAGGGSGCDGGGEPGRGDRPAERPGGEAVRLSPRRAASGRR